MDKSIAFDLISGTLTKTTSGFGDYTETTSRRTVYGQITSVSMDEFFSGGANGFRPEYRITMFGPDYEGERTCEVNGIEYNIYRTYAGRNDTLELYLERRTGRWVTNSTSS